MDADFRGIIASEYRAVMNKGRPESKASSGNRSAHACHAASDDNKVIFPLLRHCRHRTDRIFGKS